ncbi:hypothetical protein KO528_09595 [Saccharophagus degradans]|uniref:Uncharacterized protein n=1 Tax=Saccharophagus degradans TaxID=86304 RepID=A0AAW7X1A3_9GAMM|nr:hypothetical protein [Saccharophagus degradans]MBU2985601.1 hypothetical protein [Saccharophagus degradans]MDO6421259.1 hypothetical protein [Saccharophagus degradans]MDO6605830.1 hypothetical protein [Saccharophagus degradans]WGO96567.1 hypothetical protein QFX18_10955 [Saccharophagus degradans]
MSVGEVLFTRLVLGLLITGAIVMATTYGATESSAQQIGSSATNLVVINKAA